jgi:hypothetical protein
MGDESVVEYRRTKTGKLTTPQGGELPESLLRLRRATEGEAHHFISTTTGALVHDHDRRSIGHRHSRRQFNFYFRVQCVTIIDATGRSGPEANDPLAMETLEGLDGGVLVSGVIRSVKWTNHYYRRHMAQGSAARWLRNGRTASH